MRLSLKNSIGKISRKQLRFFFFIFIVLTGILSSAVYLKTLENSEGVLADQDQKRLLVLARSGASSLEFFFNNIGAELKHLNSIEEIAELREPAARKILDDFIANMPKSSLIGFSRIDGKGKYIISANIEKNRIIEGMDMSDRDYFKWAKDPSNRGKINYSIVISKGGIRKGKPIVTITVPSYSNNKFTGILLAVVDVEHANETFIEPLKIYKNTKVLIVDSNGNVILGDWQDKTMINSLSREEGVLVRNNKNIAYNTLSIGDQKGKIVIINEQDLVRSFLYPIASVQQIGLLLIIIGFIGGGILFVLIDSASGKDGFLKGYKSALEELKKKG